MKAKSKKAARAVASRTSVASHAAPVANKSDESGIEARIDSLAEILRRHELNELEIEEGGVRIYLRRGGEVVTTVQQHTPAAPAVVTPHAPPPTASGALPTSVHSPNSTDTSDGNVLYVTSPFVGTFYRSPSPDTSAFVDVGTRIKKGQVLCIVEAMKLMNEIESEIDGTIVADPRRERPGGRVRAAALQDQAGVRRADVQKDPDRQPRRDRAARDSRLPRAGHRNGGRALDGRRRRAARQVRRRERLHRPAAVAKQSICTSRRSSAPPRSPAPTPSIPATASSRRTPSSPRSAERCGLTFIGPPPDADAADGRQDPRARSDGRGRRADAAGHRPPRDRRAGAGSGRRDRLAGDHQGGGRRRRSRHEDRQRSRAELLGAARASRAPRRWPASATPDVYIERYFEAPRHIEMQVVGRRARRRGASRASASARSSAATRSSSRRRRRIALTEASARELSAAAERRCAPSATRTSARWSSCSTSDGELLLHGDEHAHPGRAPGDRDGHRARPRARADPLAAGEPLSPSFTGALRGRAATRSSAASTPRTRSRSRRRRASITALNVPGGLGVRVDTHVYEGYVVPPNYDSLLAKLIVHAEDREAAIRRLRRALGEFVVEGIQTNITVPSAAHQPPRFHRR